MGAQESIMSNQSPLCQELKEEDQPIFNTTYGVSWFAGSFLMGFLYDFSLDYLEIFSVVIQLLSIPFFILVIRKYYLR